MNTVLYILAIVVYTLLGIFVSPADAVMYALPVFFLLLALKE